MDSLGKSFALILVALFLISLITVSIPLIKAQTRFSLLAKPIQEDAYSYGINIGSPANITYSSNSIFLNVTIKRPVSPNDYDFTIMYTLNGEANVTVPSTETFFDMTTPDSIWSALMSYTSISGTAHLQNLSEGYHFLTVFGVYERARGISTKYPAVMYDIQTVYFTINDGVAPSIANLGIENSNYNQNGVPLNFTVDEPIYWMGYSLDGEANVTFTGNMTLNGLAYGSHGLVVYANDTVGNMGATGNVNFTVERPEVVPILPIAIVSMAVILAVCAGLVVYHKKHKPRNKSFGI